MKSIHYIILIILILAVAGFFVLGGSGAKINEDAVNGGSENFQKVVLGTKNLNYYPNTITVKANRPVRIYLDESVTGCLRSFTIRDFGIAKNLRTPNDYVEFTPTQKGTFRFSCSMGMGTGTLIVE